MNAHSPPSTIEKIRKRDGDSCWLCGGALDFTAKANSRKAPTKEHLDAQSRGGGDELSNLVLCHPGCNKQLGNRPLADKLKMKAKMAANRARMAATKAGLAVVAHHVPIVEARKPVRKQVSSANGVQMQLRRWQLLAFACAGLALFAFGLAGGALLAR